jgi:hypothetical protein
VQAAINALPAGSTIRVCAGTYPERITVNKNNLTLLGAGAGNTTLNGTGLGGSVVIVTSGINATVQDMRITGGQAGASTNNNGGGIFNNGTLTVLGVTVTDNAAPNAGGGITNQGTLILGANAFVTFNTAGGGGGIANFSGNVTLQANSHVDNNIAPVAASVGAGGIWNHATLTLEPNSSVSNNTAASIGGGLRSMSGVVTLQAGSQVRGNQAADGGGVWESGGSVTAADSGIVTGNTPNNCRPVGAVPNCIG